jgi:hypothetical protein
MACTRLLNDPERIRRFIAKADEALNRALADCEDHDGSYRATLDEETRASLEAVIAHACKAAEYLHLAAAVAESL